MQITYLKNCLFTFNFSLVSLFPLLLWILTEYKTKLKIIFNLNKVKHKFVNIQTAFDFLSTTVLRDKFKWFAFR